MASSLDSLNYSNVFAPKNNIHEDYLADFQQGQAAVQGIFDQQYQAQLRQQQAASAQQRLAQGQQELDQNAQLLPVRLQAAKDEGTVRAHTIAGFPLQDATARQSFEQQRRENVWYGVTHPEGGYVDMNGSQPLPSSTPVSPPAGPSGTLSNIAPNPDGTFSTTGTVFAGIKDRAAYDKAKASGASELQALSVGDNGIGAWGTSTSTTEKNYVALPPQFISQYHLNPGDPVTVNGNGKSATAFLADKLPNNSKNGAGIDINPGTAGALGVDPDNFKGGLTFSVGGKGAAPLSSASGPAQPSSISDNAIVPATTESASLLPTSLSLENSPIFLGANPQFPPGQPVNSSSGIPTDASQLARVGTTGGMITKRIEGIQRADGQFVPGGQPRLPGDRMAVRDAQVASPAQLKADAGLLATARRFKINSDYPIDEKGLSPEDRTELNTNIQAAQKDASSASMYDPDTIDYMAQISTIDPSDPRGRISGMGPQASAARAMLDAKRAQISAQTGKTGAEAVADYAGVTGAKKTIAVQEKQRASIEGFEQTARDNAQIALDLMDKGAAGSNGVPLFNRWIQAGRKATGDTDVAAFNTAIGAFTNEYAKIISGSTGSAGASDSSRREAEELINKGGTPEQLRAQLGIAFQEMGNRSKAIGDQIDRLNGSIRDRDKPKGQQAGKQAPAASNTVRVQLPNGKTGNIPADDLPAALAAGATQL